MNRESVRVEDSRIWLLGNCPAREEKASTRQLSVPSSNVIMGTGGSVYKHLQEELLGLCLPCLHRHLEQGEFLFGDKLSSVIVSNLPANRIIPKSKTPREDFPMVSVVGQLCDSRNSCGSTGLGPRTPLALAGRRLADAPHKRVPRAVNILRPGRYPPFHDPLSLRGRLLERLESGFVIKLRRNSKLLTREVRENHLDLRPRR